MKPVQYFTEDYLAQCQSLSKDSILEFLENFRQVQGIGHEPLKLISLRVSPSLLNAFKAKAKMTGVPYQTKIKELMLEWLQEPST